MENYVRFELLGYRWTVKPEFARIIKEEVIPAVLLSEDSPRLSVVKRKPARDLLLFSTNDPSPGIFVKVHNYNKLRERIKTMFRASRARAEWVVGERMFKRGLPVAEPLGLGERRAGGVVTGCVLFLREIPGCVRLNDAIEREGLLEAVGGLVRRIHSAGFWHPDLHTGNILVDPESDSPKLWLVDLHSAGCAARVGRHRRMADLAKMVFSLEDSAEELRLREMLRAYEPGAAAPEIEDMLAKLSEAAAALRKRRLRSRSKRCLKTSGKFVVETAGDKKLYRGREFDAENVLSAVGRHKGIRSSKGPEFVKETPKSVLTSFPLPSGDGEKVYVKEFANRGVIKLLEAIFYVHRGRRAWRAGHFLRILGIPCAEPVALIEEKRLGLLRTSYLIMKEIPDATPLDVFLLNRYFRVNGRLRREEILQKRTLIRSGAHALREFHSKGIYHKDLSAKNLLVGLGGDAGFRFYCVDSDSIQFPRRLSLRRRIGNLAQLNGAPACITAADRIRFYNEYSGLRTLTLKHKLLISLVRWISRRRVRLSRQADRELRERVSSGTEAYEDIASL